MDRTLVFGFNLEKDKCIIQDRKLKVHVDGQDKKYPGNKLDVQAAVGKCFNF